MNSRPFPIVDREYQLCLKLAERSICLACIICASEYRISSALLIIRHPLPNDSLIFGKGRHAYMLETGIECTRR